MYSEYESVIGLEIHVELNTKTKVFCSCKNIFGAEPNTSVCPICMGHPGALPKLNKKVVEYAARLSLALNGKVQNYSRFDRKNYFYADMPKSYQITQFYHPINLGGFVDIDVDGYEKRINITRIHIEEDAGKLIHRDNETLIDFNRAGVPLLEIVTEPDFRTAEEVKVFLKKLRTIILYTGISDCKMNEGSFRCDVNLSVRKVGESQLRERTEIKNLNSFLFVGKAIESEFRRQCEKYNNGEIVVRETLRYNPDDNMVYTMRSKEEIGDYRYFPEPDLRPVLVNSDFLDDCKKDIPELPDSRIKRYVSMGISKEDAQTLTNEKTVSDYFDSVSSLTEYRKTAASFILGEMSSIAGESLPVGIRPESLAVVCNLFMSEEINSSTAKKLIRELWTEDFDVILKVESDDLKQINDKEKLIAIAKETIANNEKLVSDYKNGKTSASKAIMGQAMRMCYSKANPGRLEAIILELLDN